jgi:hypothetical protein
MTQIKELQATLVSLQELQATIYNLCNCKFVR